ncbi:MAG: hypothetical protein H6577_24700 [Lewinellaceae bacterium]|nr:hypothetical protein [Saprospiraceae bacterium]MCB9341336.1 hypothetical protein [Lewinellaceae bacterium]
MKKQFVLAAALMLSISLVPFGNAAIPPVAGYGLKASLKNGQEAMTIEMQLSHLNKQRTVVSLQDMEGKEWFSTVIWKKETAGKLLNLSGMPTGDYLLWITGGAGEYLQMLNLGHETVKLFEPASQEDLVEGTVMFTGTKKVGKTIARITPEGNKSIAVQLANLKKEATTVALYSVGAGPLLVQKIKDEQAYARNFNMEGMPYGSYFLSLHTKEATICQFFILSKDGLTFGPVQHCPAKSTLN